jgi:hypothetical protein
MIASRYGKLTELAMDLWGSASAASLGVIQHRLYISSLCRLFLQRRRRVMTDVSPRLATGVWSQNVRGQAGA